MYKCPKCGSSRIHYSRTKTLLEQWRRRLTHKRPYRCRDCKARTWAIDSGPHFSQESIDTATRAIAPDPPNLKVVGLSREDRRRDHLDFDDLDNSLKTSE